MRPMATAPSTGRFLVYGGECSCDVYPEDTWPNEGWCMVERDGADFNVVNIAYYGVRIIGATHWMPEPEKPQGASEMHQIQVCHRDGAHLTRIGWLRGVRPHGERVRVYAREPLPGGITAELQADRVSANFVEFETAEIYNTSGLLATVLVTQASAAELERTVGLIASRPWRLTAL